MAAHLQQPLPPTPLQTTLNRPSKRAPVPLILSSFPAPPSHIPSAPISNPPPTGPPAAPLPPLPSGASRISEHEQLHLLSSHARRSSKYSQRDSIITNGSPNRDSMVSTRSPSAMGRPSLSISRSNSITSTPTYITRMSMSPAPLSNISDSDTEPAKTMSSPANSPRILRHRRTHQANESISSIDMRDVLGVYGDDYEDIYHCHPSPRSSSSSTPSSHPQSRPRYSQHNQHKSIADPIDPEMLLSRLDLEDSFIMPLPPVTTAKLPSPTSASPSLSPSLSPSRRSPAAATSYYSHSPNRSLSESYKLGHARSTSTVTADSAASHSHTPMQNHMRSSSNSSTTVAQPSRGGGGGGLGLGLGLPTSMPISTSEGASPLSPSPSSSSSSSSTSPSISTSTTSTNTESKMIDSYSTTTQFSTTTSSSSSVSLPSTATMTIVKDFERAERSVNEAHKKVLVGQSGSGGYAGEGGKESGGDVVDEGGRKDERETAPYHHYLSQVGLGGIVVTKTTTTTRSAPKPTTATVNNNKTTHIEGKGRGNDEMTLDELGIPSDSTTTTTTTTTVLTAKDCFKEQNYPDINYSTSAQPPASAQSPRIPSPDIATILSTTPRSALSLSRSRCGGTAASANAAVRSKSRSKSRVSAGQRRVVSANTHTSAYPDGNYPLPIRRQSEGATINAMTTATSIPAHDKNLSSELAYLHKHADSSAGIGPNGLPLSNNNNKKKKMSSGGGYYEQEAAYDEALERVLEGGGSEDEEDAGVDAGVTWDNKQRGRRSGKVGEKVVQEEEIIGEERGGGGGGGDSDSSLDLHTPLPHLMLRHGLLSPNSKLLPQAECSRAATPSEGRPGSIISLISNGSVVKPGIIKDERDTPNRRVRHRDGRLLRGGIGLTTGLGWSDSEDEDAPSPLTRRLSTLNLSRRSSASSIRSANLPPSSSASLRRLHPLSRSYSSGAILEKEREDDKNFGSYHSSYPYDYDNEAEEEEEEEEEDYTLEESGKWAQRHRLGKNQVSSPPVSWQHHRRLEITIPEDREEEKSNDGKERPKTPSRLRRPSSHASMRCTTLSVNQRRSGAGAGAGGGDDNDNNSNNTPPSTTSTLSIPMPATPKDIFDPAAPPLLSSTMLMNKEKSLPPLPNGGLKKKLVIASNGTSSTTTTSTAASNGAGKYAFVSMRTRTFSSTSNSTPLSPMMNVASSSTTAPTLAAAASSTATVKPHVRPLQLPRQTTSRIAGDRPAVPVPSPSIPNYSPPPPPSPATTTLITSAGAANNNLNSLRAPTLSLSTLSTTTRRTPMSPILSSQVGITTTSAPSSPAAINGVMMPLLSTPKHNGGGITTPNGTTTGIVRPKPRTGTGMVYRTSSYGGPNSKMPAPMMLSASSSVVSGGGGGSGDGGGSIGRSNGVPRAIAL